MKPSHLERFDLVVLGGGPAGMSGALSGGLLGKKVALVEQATVVGGAGINTGTIPSKTLRETSLMLSGWRSRQLHGVDLSLRREATVGDFMRHQKHVTDSERQRIEHRLALRGVKKVHGSASFLNAHTVRIVSDTGAEKHIYGEKILIATGSSPLRPPQFPCDDDRVHDSNEILELEALPRKLSVIGGGVIGDQVRK